MSKHAGMIVALGVLLLVLWLASASQIGRGHGDAVLSISAASPAPDPPNTTIAPTPGPTPTPTQNVLDTATGITAHAALIAWLAAFGILPFAGYVAPVLIGRHRSKLPTQDWRIPYRAPQFPQVLEAHVRTSHPPVPQTYSPSLHIRNDPGVEVEQPSATLPALGGVDELLSHGRGLAYGWRVDNGEMLVDRQVRSLLVGGVQGSGKTSFVTLLVAQLARMDARVMLADPDALNPEGLATRLAGLGIEPEETAHEPAEVLSLVLQAQHELMTRKGQARYSDSRPYVLIVDEFDNDR